MNLNIRKYTQGNVFMHMYIHILTFSIYKYAYYFYEHCSMILTFLTYI